MSNNFYDHIIKLILIGDSNVGKSCILKKLMNKTYNSEYQPTIGIDYKIKTFFLDGKKIKVEIWDTAGQERYRSIVSSYYRGASGIIVVYDTSCEKSFKNLKNWINGVTKNTYQNVKIIIAGNKCDLIDSREVSKEKIIEYSKELNLPFIEVSAKTNYNIDIMFEILIREIIKDQIPYNTIKNTLIENENNKNNCEC